MGLRQAEVPGHIPCFADRMEVRAMPDAAPTITHQGDLWIVRVWNAKGKTQEYRCASESQAKQLLLVLASKPAEVV